MARASWIVLLCALAQGFDIGGELRAALARPAAMPAGVWIHLIGESLAALGLGAVYVAARREARRQAAVAAQERDRRRALQDDFDRLVKSRFAQWGLTQAEADVALLTLRGLRIAEIAGARNVQPGTVKAQLSTVLHKAGVATRTELVALFIDEFLDQAHPARAAGPAAT